jgi:hypothetical protein
MERAGDFLPKHHQELFVSKQRLDQADSVRMVRLRRETRCQTLGYAPVKPDLHALAQDPYLAPFDEQEYLAMNPDVRGAVQAGVFSSGQEHWVSLGRAEGPTVRLVRPASEAAAGGHPDP